MKPKMIAMKMRVISMLILMGFAGSFFPHPLFSDDDLRVEGIVYEKNTPEETMAVVNGVPLKKGDIIQDYTVTEIKQTSVDFIHKNGQSKKVSLLAARPPKISAVKETMAAVPSPPAQKEPEEKKPEFQFPGFDMSALMTKMTSLSVIMDLKNLQSRAMIHYSQQNDLPTIKSLIESGELNPAFENGTKGNYNFEIKGGAKGDPVVFADPIDQHPELPHYMADEWGNIRIEKDKRATAKSSIYQS